MNYKLTKTWPQKAALCVCTVLIAMSLIAAVKAKVKYEVSTYFNPEFAAKIALEKDGFRKNGYEKPIETMHERAMARLQQPHKLYFQRRSQFKVLDYASGDIFGNKERDYVFVVFDMDDIILRILTYNAKNNEYRLLYQTMKVVNGMGADCSCGFPGSVDYALTQRLDMDQTVDTRPEKTDGTEYKGELCVCADITQDATFILGRGCYLKGGTRPDLGGFTSMCFSTDATYNNWVCMRYDKKLNAFVMFYCQAFKD